MVIRHGVIFLEITLKGQFLNWCVTFNQVPKIWVQTNVRVWGATPEDVNTPSTHTYIRTYERGRRLVMSAPLWGRHRKMSATLGHIRTHIRTRKSGRHPKMSTPLYVLTYVWLRTSCEEEEEEVACIAGTGAHRAAS